MNAPARSPLESPEDREELEDARDLARLAHRYPKAAKSLLVGLVFVGMLLGSLFGRDFVRGVATGLLRLTGVPVATSTGPTGAERLALNENDLEARRAVLRLVRTEIEEGLRPLERVLAETKAELQTAREERAALKIQIAALFAVAEIRKKRTTAPGDVSAAPAATN